MTRDPGVLAALLDRLAIERADLRRLSLVASEVVLGDVDKLKSLKYSFVIAIEVCIDICQHLVSKNRMRSPQSFADAFSVLAEAGVISAELAVELADIARFRNLLVHGYVRVDDAQVIEILHTRLPDIDAFVIAVSQV